MKIQDLYSDRDSCNALIVSPPCFRSEACSRTFSTLSVHFALLFAFAFGIGAGSFQSSTCLAADSPLQPIAERDFKAEILPFFQTYCSDCHSSGYQEGDFGLHRYAEEEALKQDRGIWTKVLHLVKLGAMPPSEVDQPNEEDRKKVVEWLEHQLFYVDCSQQHEPGRVTVRRLNRLEYDNTVRDLLGVDFHPSDDFPSDDVGYGFDNIGDVLSVPPLLIEKYLNAAEQVVEQAIPTHHPDYVFVEMTGDRLKKEGSVNGSDGGWKVMPSRGTVIAEFDLKAPGRYQILIEAKADQAGSDQAKMEIHVDEKSLRTVEIEGHRKSNDFSFEIRSRAGKKVVSATFLNDFYDAEADGRKDRNLYVRNITIEGPLDMNADIRKDYPLIGTMPSRSRSVRQAATENLRDFLPRAFRRPVTTAEIQRYAEFAQLATDRNEGFERAMQIAVQAVLVSPEFLFRVESSEQIGNGVEQLDDYALASRLSYFLWSSLPDDELFELAKQKRLRDPNVLKKQTERMLKDPKSKALIESFSGQWLGLRRLATDEVAPDPKLFPEFDEQLRSDMWKETELFFGAVVNENRSIYDLLNGRYTFLNERLAKLYGIEGIQGEDFRKVQFKNEPRLGVLTNPSILTLTSYPNRTSPVKRGQWVLENLLNDPPPDPPPSVPTLEEAAPENLKLSFREQLELHRQDPGCASCHVLMDGIGFGLENFDPIGRWRTKDGEFPVDASGELPSGESFRGPEELVGILNRRKEQFGRCLTEKLLTYAIGRGVEYYDRCAVDEILNQLEEDDRFSALVLQIVKSTPFQMRRSTTTQTITRK